MVARAAAALRWAWAADAIDHRLQRERLHPLYRGVYAVGQRQLRREARWMAAVLACGAGRRAEPPRRGRALADRATGWPVRGDRSDAAALPSGGHACTRRALPADEVTVHEGIPVTTVPRTLFDLAAVLPQRQLERAINEAELLHLWDELSLDHLLHRYPRHRGSKAIRAALQRRRAAARLRPRASSRSFPRADRRRRHSRARRPTPSSRASRSTRSGGTQRLVVELDRRDTHGNRRGVRARPRARPHSSGRRLAPGADHLPPAARSRGRWIDDLRRLLGAGTLAA